MWHVVTSDDTYAESASTPIGGVNADSPLLAGVSVSSGTLAAIMGIVTAAKRRSHCRGAVGRAFQPQAELTC